MNGAKNHGKKLLSFFFSGWAEHDRHDSEHDSSLTASLTAQGTSMTGYFFKEKTEKSTFL